MSYAADEARQTQWIPEADHEPDLLSFYEGACGLSHDEAGLLRLDSRNASRAAATHCRRSRGACDRLWSDQLAPGREFGSLWDVGSADKPCEK